MNGELRIYEFCLNSRVIWFVGKAEDHKLIKRTIKDSGLDIRTSTKLTPNTLDLAFKHSKHTGVMVRHVYYLNSEAIYNCFYLIKEDWINNRCVDELYGKGELPLMDSYILLERKYDSNTKLKGFFNDYFVFFTNNSDAFKEFKKEHKVFEVVKSNLTLKEVMDYVYYNGCIGTIFDELGYDYILVNDDW